MSFVKPVIIQFHSPSGEMRALPPCSDCGAVPQEKRKHTMRLDICDECWQLRIDFLNAVRDGRLTADDLRASQKKMAGKRGTAAAFMRKRLEEATR